MHDTTQPTVQAGPAVGVVQGMRVLASTLILEDFDDALGWEKLVEHLCVRPQLAEFGHVYRRQLGGPGISRPLLVPTQAHQAKAKGG
jgi:hypothetical protein